VSIWPRNVSASAAERVPFRAPVKSRSQSARDRSAVIALGWPWGLTMGSPRTS